MPGGWSQSVLKPGARIDFNDQVLTGRAVEQNFHLTDSEVIEQSRGLARKACRNGVRMQFDTTAHSTAISRGPDLARAE